MSTAQLKAFSTLGHADTYDTIIAKDAITSGDSVTLTGGATFQLSGAGANTVTLGAGGVTVKAGAAGNTITSGAGADTITLGAGTDTVVFVANNGQDTVSSLAAGDTVNVYALSGGALTGPTAIENTGVDLTDKALYTIALEGDGALTTSSLVGANAIHTSVTSGHKAIVVVDYTDKTGNADGVYVCAVSATDTTLDANMITTVGVFDAAAGVVAAALDGTALV